jgi:hypothetical protein
VISFGYRMATRESDQLHLWFLFRYAMDRRSPVRISYFEQKKDDDGRRIPDQFVKITRIVEPHGLEITADGRRVVKVVDRAPEGHVSPKGPDYRTYRLDRVAVRNGHDGKPLVHCMSSYGYLCPTLLDGVRLYPRKTVPKDYPPGTVPVGYEGLTASDWAALVA